MVERVRAQMYNQRRVAEAALVPGTREPPPPTLNAAEAAIWVEVVERLPIDWFTSENKPLLKEYCRHIGHSDALAVDIEKVRARLVELEAGSLAETERRKAIRRATGEYHALLRLQAFQSERIGNLATKLRLSQQSRLPAPKATPKADHVPAGPKPWQGWADLGDRAPLNG